METQNLDSGRVQTLRCWTNIYYRMNFIGLVDLEQQETHRGLKLLPWNFKEDVVRGWNLPCLSEKSFLG